VHVLFVKQALAWPRSSGHDVLTFHMLKACAELGHEVSLATVVLPEDRSIEGLVLKHYSRLTAPLENPSKSVQGSWLQRRFRSFWGVDDFHVLALQQVVESQAPDAVVVVGLDALPYFPGLRGPVRIWYAADEWVLHHLSMVRPSRGHFFNNLRAAAIKGLYERVHRRVVDRVWVVTERDRSAMRHVSGIKDIDVVPIGVDADFFKPGQEPVQERTAVFWGRLDFGPNVQALEWFCRRVWPSLHSACPDARFKIIGFHPGPEVKALAKLPGISLEANVHDLRPVVRTQALVVLPLVSGAGMKNKLLEAAALGLPVVCTPLATLGLRGTPPIVTVKSAQAFSDAVLAMWRDHENRAGRSRAIRDWAIQNHSWRAAAESALAPIARVRGGQA
jgi:glycosyltransferase involved in cell wall biosynthesis